MSCCWPEPRVGLLETPPRWHTTTHIFNLLMSEVFVMSIFLISNLLPWSTKGVFNALIILSWSKAYYFPSGRITAYLMLAIVYFTFQYLNSNANSKHWFTCVFQTCFRPRSRFSASQFLSHKPEWAGLVKQVRLFYSTSIMSHCYTLHFAINMKTKQTKRLITCVNVQCVKEPC